MRRVRFGIRGDHAQVSFLRQSRQRKEGFPDRPQIIKRTARAEVPAVHTAAQMLAHLLFPANFPRIVASKDRKTHFSEAVDLTPASLRGIKGYYANKDRHRIADETRFKRYRQHRRRIEERMDQKSMELENAGFSVNAFAMNTGETKKGDIVFFEVLEVHLPTVTRQVRSLPEGPTKKQALALLETLKNAPIRPDGRIRTHQE
jgi:hypothetical protein